MDMSLKKITLIRWLTELNDISVINKIEQLRNMQEHVPMTIDELISRHLQSENDIQNNNLIEQSELQKYYQNQLNAL
jgi:hypothetical protein